MKINEYVKGQYRLYLCALLKLARLKVDSIGEDKGMVGQTNKHRRISITSFEGKEYLNETKYSKAMADFTRSYEIRGTEEQPEFIFIQDWQH